MSSTFTVVDALGRTIGLEARVEPCLCAQCAPCFVTAFDSGTRGHEDELAACASPECGICEGCGVERVERPAAGWFVNLCESSAMALRGLLGLRGAHGRLDLAAARAAIVRGARDLEQIDVMMPHGARVGIEYRRDGRHVTGELTLDGLRARFLRLHDLIERGAEAGGVALVWS